MKFHTESKFSTGKQEVIELLKETGEKKEK